MKKRFTILSAALALLAFLVIPMGMRGQTTDVINHDATSSYLGNTATTAWASNFSITGTSGAVYYIHSMGTKSTSNALQFNKNGFLYMTGTSSSGEKLKSITINGTSGKSLYIYAQNAAFTAEPTNTSSAITTMSLTGSAVTYTFTSNYTYLAIHGKDTSTSIVSVTIEWESNSTPIPTMSVSTNSIDFGSNAINPAEPYTETFNVTFANLTENLTVTGFSGVSVSPATISANATSPQTVTVSYNPTAAGNISGNISVNSSEVDEALVAVTGSAYDPANVDSYELYTGEIVEGDYVIYNTHGAMKNELNGGPRFNNESVTISDDIITNPTNNVIWHIAPIENTEYWTIYNAAINKYAGGTTSKNQGALYDDYTNDHAKWKIYYSYSTLYIENLGRSQDANDSGNKYLRQNTTATAGWATYANSGSYVPKLYKKVITNQVATPTFSVVAGTYYEPKTVELSCETSGASIYYTTDGTTPSASNGTVYTTAISVSTTTTIKAIAIATGMTDSDVATATYTIEQPYSAIPALFEAATNTEQDVRVTFNNWVVSGVSINGKSVYVTDNNGNGFIIYFTSDMSGTFAAGDILSGTAVACKLKLYNGAAELVNLTATDLTITTGGTVSISNIPMSDLSGVNTGALVSYNNLTCSVSDNKYNLTDGTTTLQAYNTLYAFNEFVAGKTYNVTGVYVQYNSIKEIAPRSAADIVEVEVQHEEYTLTVSNLSHVNLFIFGGEESETIISTEDGETTAQVYDGTEVLVSIDVEAGYVFQSLTITDGNGAPVETEELTANEYYSFLMPTSNVTITATAVEYVAPVGGDYVRITSLDQLTDGSKVIIAARHDEQHTNGYYAMQNATSGKPLGTSFTSVTSGNDEAVASTITDDEDNYYWTVNVTENGYTFTNANDQMIGYSSGTDFASDINTEWTIESVQAGNNAMVPGYEGFVIKNGTTTTRAFAFNGTAFGAYATTNMNAGGYNFFLDFFVQTSAPATESYTLTINGYAEGSRGGYYLIASPVTVDPATVGGMTEGDFDLYYYDQAQDREWINYKVGDDGTGGPFNLTPGTGYLYAKKATPETMIYNFNLVGTPYSGNGEVFLHKSVENEIMSGWNLVGNPFAQTAYIDRDFYVMKDNGEEIITANRENNEVNMMEGVFVIANSHNEPLTFSTTPIANSGSKLVLNLSQGRGIVDRAIVRFGEGRTLPKFMLNNENTKLYIPQEGNDYAVVYAEDQGELPLNFKAAEDGTYTLSFSNENTEFSSLHLIDNMSRADIDLLANPSYTFDAQATDEETRFTLVYEKAGSTLTIGTGSNYSGSGYQEPTATDYGAGSPMGNTYFTYSTAQFIYTAEEMGGAKTINSLAFKHNNFGSFIGTVKIYLVHTSNSEVHVSNPATSGTLVYTGTNITLGSNSNEWQTFNLDTPFEYDGSHNLLVVVCRTKATSGTPNYNVDQGWQYTTYSGHYRYMVRSKSISTYGDITNTEHYVRGFKRPNIKFGYTAPVVNHFDLNIKGWTSNNNNYYLIASPIGQVNPSDVTNMLSNSYDLFYFDQAGDDQGYEWITYKAGEGATDPGFNLVPGKGYLYANSGVATNNPNIVTLTFTGSAYTGSGQVNLVYTEENPVPYMRGWNLVGNPFGVDAYIDRSYYAMNSDGTEIEPHSGVIAPMQGLFVHVDQNETMTFTTTPPSKGSSLSLNVSKGRGIIDRAILNFSEGRQLPKFQLNPNHTKVYMPVEGTDYAVISTEEQGEMPVSFKAEENGTYTFSFDTENVEFDYLHLIDNKTGVNVDLLSTPSYSFEAKTTDYESRFKLVFATICEDADGDSETFAFYSNGSFVINNEGVATLQVIDVMGRIISSESINGSANVNINAADGVYMLRLINGESVKTQKVVVK